MEDAAQDGVYEGMLRTGAGRQTQGSGQPSRPRASGTPTAAGSRAASAAPPRWQRRRRPGRGCPGRSRWPGGRRRPLPANSMLRSEDMARDPEDLDTLQVMTPKDCFPVMIPNDSGWNTLQLGLTLNGLGLRDDVIRSARYCTIGVGTMHNYPQCQRIG